MMNRTTRLILISFLFCGLLVSFSPRVFGIEIAESAFGSGTFGLNDSVSYRAVIRGTEPTPFGAVTFEGPFAYIVYAQGADIYGNAVYYEIRRGTLTGLRGQVVSGDLVVQEPTSITLEGAWVIPDDGTLHNTVNTYSLVVAVYPAATFPTILAAPPAYAPPPFALDSPLISANSSAGIFINVVPDIAMNSPGAVYKAGEYRGKDIIPITTSWRNDDGGEPGRQSRPIGLIGDGYTMSLRLSTDAEFAESETAANDDFSFYSYFLGGDLGGLIADGTTDFRQVVVTGTPGPVPTYGITGVPGTERIYFPQPDDGFLDIGESVDWVVQTMIPENYASDGYFVVTRVRMNDETRDASAGNNTFASNGADKIAILETASPSISPVSAVTTETGNYVQGGNAASDGGAVSEDGSAVVFVSRATNLLAPASGSGATVPTVGQQVFLKLPATGEVDLISGPGVGLVSANADCFNPTVSANGRYIAYDSAASNILSSVFTAGKSMIFVYDRTTGDTVIVSRNRDGVLADGSSFNPKLSQSGRFVVFESMASNLDLPKISPVITGGAITGYNIDRPGSGYPLAPATPPAISVLSPTGVPGAGATATATVGPVVAPPMIVGGISQITPTADGSGYSASNPPAVTVANPPAGPKQVYLHDRDSDEDGVFDEPGQIATYLVSGNVRALAGGGTAIERSDNLSYAPVVNLEDTAAAITANGGVYVAYASYASNLPDANRFGSMVYRALIRVTGAADARGLAEVEAVSVNNDGDIPTLAPAEYAAGFKPDSYQPSINGDGSQIAFTSWGSNLVYNPTTGGFDADTNGVQDVFVRDFSATPPSTVRVSVSEERVATGVVAFVGAVGPDNILLSQPAPGDTVTLDDGVDARTFIFDPVNPPAPGEIDVAIGASVQETRDNLIDRINGAGMRLQAFATTPPNEAPGTSYVAAIYIRNTVPGEAGNVPITVVSANLVLAAEGMAGGGSQATDAPVAVQGVPFGSSEPSIDRTGRYVAFRTIAENLDVHTRTAANNYDGSPITGELIRPLIFPTSNVYVRDRLADGDRGGDYDIPANSKTTRVSVNKFGYPTFYGGTQSGVGSPLTANSATPTISANGRFVVFSSDAEGQGGLVFGPNNLTPLDNDRIRSVFLHDRRTLSDDPPPPSTRPVVELTSPTDGLRVPPGSTIAISARATPAAGKQINNVQFYINGSPFGPALTAEPYSLTYTLPTAGQYSVRAVVTDSKGITSSDSATIIAGDPILGDSPLVAVTQPSSQFVNYVIGSDLVFNATAQDPDGTVESVTFYLSGQPIPAQKGFDNNWYAPFRPTKTGTFSFFAAATDNNGNTSLTDVGTIVFGPTGASFPTVDVVANNEGLPAVAGGVYPLRARITGPVPGITYTAENSFVRFYADDVYLGLGVLQADGTYLLEWNVPDTPRSYAKIYAYLESPNRFTAPDDDPTDVTSVIVRSKNFLTVNAIEGEQPAVLFRQPLNNSTVQVGSSVLLEVTASVPPGQGVIAKVEFYQNGELIGEDADGRAPYAVNFIPPSQGNYALVALVYSTAGVIGRSDAVAVNAVLGAPPVVEFISPRDGSSIPPTFPITLAIAAAGGSGSITTIEYTVNGQVIPASTAGPLEATYTPQFPGLYDFRVRVVNSVGYQTIASALVTVENPQPGTEGSFVMDAYESILGETPVPDDYFAAVEELENGLITRAEFVYALLQSDAYLNTRNRLFDFYYTLGASPTASQFNEALSTSYLSLLLANTEPMTGYDGFGGTMWIGTPFGATLGEVNVAQRMVNTLSSTVRNLASSTFVNNYMFPRLGGTALGNPAEIVAGMDSYNATSQAKGSAVAFMTAFYQNFDGTRNSAQKTLQQQYQLQLYATSVQWLLGGPWQPRTTPGTYPSVVARTSNLQIDTEAKLLQFIGTLLAEPQAVLVVPGSARAGSATINATTGAVTSVVLAAGGSGYTSAPAVLVGPAPYGGTNASVTASVSSGAVSSLAVSAGGSGYSSAPQVLVKPPALLTRYAGTDLELSSLALPTPYASVTKVEYLVNNAVAVSKSTTTEPAIIKVPGAGDHELRVRVTDSAGNVALSEPAVTLRSFAAVEPGLVLVTPDSARAGTPVLSSGAVSSIPLAAVGTGYTAAPVVRISPPLMAGVPAAATASLGVDGSVAGLNLTSGGDGYTTAPVVLVAPPTEIFAAPGSSANLSSAGFNGSSVGVATVELLVDGVVRASAAVNSPMSYTVPAEAGVYQLLLRGKNASGELVPGLTSGPVSLTAATRSMAKAKSWIEKNGLASERGVLILMDGHDSDGDGYKDIVEYAFGMDPAKKEAMSFTTSHQPDSLSLEWTRLRSTSSVGYILEESADLSRWTPLPTQPAQTVLASVGADYERVRATVPLSGHRKFYRVSADFSQ